MRILVVDDDPLAGAMTAAILEEMGHETLLAEDGMDAVHQFNDDEGIGMIVSDMHMPLISGIDLFHEVREQRQGLPFLLLTGDDPATLLAREPRLDACLIKDFNLATELPRVIGEVLKRHPS
ncbi:MAG: response regulator [Magnetococcales bacterium]|nr:response regulator [Magnetococcales bacterium]